MKNCVTCLVKKPLKSFSKKSSSRDGLQSACKPCVSEYNAKYAKDHPGEGTLRMRQWREDDPDRAIAQNASQHVKHRKRHNAQTSAWGKANRDKCNAALKRWRVKYPEASSADRRETARRRRGRKVLALQDGIAVDYKGKSCIYCGRPAECIDHFFALSTHFDDRSTNKVPACNECNGSKRAKSPWKWLMSDVRPLREASVFVQ